MNDNTIQIDVIVRLIYEIFLYAVSFAIHFLATIISFVQKAGLKGTKKCVDGIIDYFAEEFLCKNNFIYIYQYLYMLTQILDQHVHSFCNKKI